MIEKVFFVVVLVGVALAQSPPNIGFMYETMIEMDFPDSKTTGELWAIGDQTVLIQQSPKTEYPHIINHCYPPNPAQSSYAAFNNVTRKCNTANLCVRAHSCQDQPCACLFDNPFRALPDTTYGGTCNSGKDNLWTVKNGGYTLNYCITQDQVPLTFDILAAQGNLHFKFWDWKPVKPPSSAFTIPTFCKC